MNQKFHINKHGVPAPCRAKEGNCPLGGAEQHFPNLNDAQAYADKINEQKYGLICNVREKLSSHGEPSEPLDKSNLYSENAGQEEKEKKLSPAQLRKQEKKEFEEKLSKVLDKLWRGDKKMTSYCIKTNKYIESNGSFIEVGDSKPSIKREIFYDDEKKAPEMTYETFYNYNARLMPEHYEKEANYLYEGRGTLKIIPQYGGDNLDLATLTYNPSPKGPYREVTDEELEKINQSIDEIRNDFEKRIKSYYKTKKDKISIKSYWVNR